MSSFPSIEHNITRYREEKKQVGESCERRNNSSSATYKPKNLYLTITVLNIVGKSKKAKWFKLTKNSYNNNQVT